MIIKYRCDKPMAEKKGLLPCSHRCRSCVACIWMDESGAEQHVNLQHGTDPALQARNMIVRSYHGDYDE